MSKVVHVHLVGGLGNQLFILAAGLSYARKFNLQLAITPKNNYGKRSGYWNTILARWLDGKSPDGVIVVESGAGKAHVINENGFAYSPFIAPQNTNVVLRGYFQSARYFDSIKDEIVKAFTPAPLSKLALEIDNLASQIFTNNGSYVSLHVRRGDYVQYPTIHPILPIQYYRDSIQRGGWSPEKVTLVVFSDDIEWCRQNFYNSEQRFEGFRVLIPENLTTEATLFLMSRCNSGHVIANSSFSWWGAFLGQQFSDRPVVAPTPWFGPKGPQDTQDLYLPNWIRVDWR